MTNLPGWTVQCLNPTCEERGRWVRVETRHTGRCARCGAPLEAVPPPLPQLRARRPVQTVYRPLARGGR